MQIDIKTKARKKCQYQDTVDFIPLSKVFQFAEQAWHAQENQYLALSDFCRSTKPFLENIGP